MTLTNEDCAYTMAGLPHVVLVNAEVYHCAACGEHGIAIPRIEQLHRVIASALIAKRTRLAPNEVRF